MEEHEEAVPWHLVRKRFSEWGGQRMTEDKTHGNTMIETFLENAKEEMSRLADLQEYYRLEIEKAQAKIREIEITWHALSEAVQAVEPVFVEMNDSFEHYKRNYIT